MRRSTQIIFEIKIFYIDFIIIINRTNIISKCFSYIEINKIFGSYNVAIFFIR